MSEFITKRVIGCRDAWFMNIPWKIASKCNWEIYREETHEVYCGKVVVQHTEWMDNIREWRFTQSMLKIKIRFQLFVKVEVGSTVVNRPELTAAITKQIVSINCYDVLPALIELTTVINWPYKLSTKFELTRVPAGKVSYANYDNDDCSGVEGYECRQKWRTALTLSEGTCTLNGNYQLTFAKICVPGFRNCPIKDDYLRTTVDYSLTSENFCAVVNIDISLTATIKIYEDKEYNIPRSTFMVGQRAYFLIKVRSDLNNDKEVIQFSRVRIITITVRGPAKNLPSCICEQGKPTDYSHGEFNPVVYPEIYVKSYTNEAAFSFVFSNELANYHLKPNGKLSLTIGAEVEVSYLNNAKKRMEFELLGEETNAATFSTDAGVEGVKFDNTTVNRKTEPIGKNNGITLVVSLLLMIAILF